MAPNNALRASAEDSDNNAATSVLSRDTIEDRGVGTEDNVEKDIAAFLADALRNGTSGSPHSAQAH